MYVSRIVVRNYRNFRQLDMSLNPGVTCVVGENNSGKSNLLRAIRLPLDASLSSQFRTLSPADLSAGLGFATPQQILVSLELRDYANKENEEAMVSGWAIGDDLARVTYRFRPRPAIIEALGRGERPADGLTLDDYRWEIVGGGGDVDPATVGYDRAFGQAIRFDELQQFLVLLLNPLRDVEQALRQSRYSPLGKVIEGSEISQAEQLNLIRILSASNDSIVADPTIARIGSGISSSFAEAAGEAFRLQVELGIAAPSFDDISRSLTVLLSDQRMTRYGPELNGLGLNNVLYVSMLVRSFEQRIASRRAAGQLLLFEEPEAHLHPQLQRVLFSALASKQFQTIITTHSTHITSQMPLRSTVLLTGNVSSATSAYVPAESASLTANGIADLERYLDATRGTLLFAKKVLLVEGPAELFLVPPLVRALRNLDLEERGVSLVPIFGVHFSSYTALFGEQAMGKKCAVLADGDLTPSDTGPPSHEDPEGFPMPIRPNLTQLENTFVKVFMCKTTFERELACLGNINMFAEAASELGAPRVQQRLVECIEQGLTEQAQDTVMAAVRRFGKARFAQIASKHVGLATCLPSYITRSIDWLLQ